MEQPRQQAYAARLALVALGGNLPSPFGPPEVTLRAAVARVDETLGIVTGKSRLWRTPCMPAGAGPDYVNGAIALDTSLHPLEVLKGLHAIEAALSRDRTGRWAARTVDLDLLAIDDLILPDPATAARWRALPAHQQSSVAPDRLILPHPRLQDRPFVLVPLAEIAPDWRHPALDLTVMQMLAALGPGARDGMTPMAE